MRTFLEGEVQFDLAYSLGEGDSQFTRRIVVPEKGFGHGNASLEVREPAFEYGRDIFILPVYGQGLSSDQDEDDRLSRPVQFLQEEALAAGQVQRSAGTALARGQFVLAHNRDHHVRHLRLGHRPADALFLLRSQGFGNDLAARPEYVLHGASFLVIHGETRASQILAYPFEHRDRLVAVGSVAAGHIIGFVGQGPRDKDAAGPRLVQGQQAAFILKEHYGLAGDLADEIPVVFRPHHAVRLPSVPGIGIVEKAEAEFDREYVPDAPVNKFLGDPARVDQATHRLHEDGRLREIGPYVQSRLQHLPHRIVIILRHLMLVPDELDGVAVADHIAVESVCVTQKFRQEIRRGDDRLAVPVIVTGHHLHWMRLLHHPPEGVEVDLVQFPGIDVGVGAGARVAASLRNPIRHVMFQAGGDALLLDAGGHLDTQLRHEEWILPVALQGPAPALVPRHVEDGRIHAVVTEQARFFACDAPGMAYKIPVPGASKGYGSGERRGQGVVKAVDAFVGELGGNAQPGILHEPPLDLPQGIHVAGKRIDQPVLVSVSPAYSVEHLVDVGDAVRPYLVLPSVRGKGVLQDASIPVKRGQLTGFLAQVHLAEKVLHAVFKPRLRILVYVHPSVFVEIDPAVVIEASVERRPQLEKHKDSEKFHVCIVRFL